MSNRQRTIRLILCVTPAAVLSLLLLLLYCCTPFAVDTIGIELRPPWQDKAAWHLSRMDWFVQDAGYEDLVRKHRSALLAMGPDAVPALIEEIASGNNPYTREGKIHLLKQIGPNARPLVFAAATDAEGDRRARLLYALFAAFHDRNAFDQWLEYALQRGTFALRDNLIEYHIQDFWNTQMPDYAVPLDDGYAINPAFVKWWHTNGDTVPFVIGPG